MKRKCLAIGIILVFIPTAILPSNAQNTEKSSQSSRGDWLYVGGSGPENYTRIQEAIDNASDGDTVFVYDDSSPYFESVLIKNQINLIGEKKESTILDGNRSDYTVCVMKNASNVTIKAFTIKNPNGTEYNRGIQLDSAYNVITDNIIENTYYGIAIDYDVFHSDSFNNSIINNLVNHTKTGVFISEYSCNNTIAYNSITYSETGILLFLSVQNNIFRNYIADNSIGIDVSGIGMTSEKSLLPEEFFRNNIYQNILTKNNCGIIVWNYGFVNLTQNIIAKSGYGIVLSVGYYGSCINNTIIHNRIIGNEYGLSMEVWHKDCGGIGFNDIVENNFIGNKNAIEMISTPILSHIERNTIYHNNFLGNTRSVYLENSFRNQWVGNYWGNVSQHPYPIFGKFTIFGIFGFPWIVFDWHPAQEPYDIPGVS